MLGYASLNMRFWVFGSGIWVVRQLPCVLHVLTRGTGKWIDQYRGRMLEDRGRIVDCVRWRRADRCQSMGCKAEKQAQGYANEGEVVTSGIYFTQEET